ncbi:membrane protein [Alicyclobacillus cellulosilyticus]|uniref:Membrane protein n=1 Tax=Alicyclobacillus cellulosilyticus TaxID=1003997 RepID=A0A917KIU8_9BACL|nr:manganese efflux pump [Alicyclobacillus cellulosilyticus]GGJ13081.1 membrane protein [Alicyclobacillus cellulosilyticus]
MGQSLVTILAIALASNLDNAGVGIAYGVRGMGISWWANLIIAVISGLATLLSGWIGRVITRVLPPHLAAWLGAAALMAVGVWVLTAPWRERARRGRTPHNVVSRILRDPLAADFDRSQTISLGEATVLGLALAMNALVGGFDAGVVRIDIAWTAVAVAAASYVLLGMSAYLGRRFAAKAFGDRATVAAGTLLILIGLHQLW